MIKQYLHIIQKELPTVSEKDLTTPLKQTHIDSLDILVIRVALEKHFDIEIPDIIWYKYETLAEALKYFHENKTEKLERKEFGAIRTKNTDDIEIRMPQMSNSALSESWLLKYLGDKHWSLISEGFNITSSQFRDSNDNRIYSTFIRINYSVSALDKFRENEKLKFTSEISGFGANTFLSHINGEGSTKHINANLLTTFSIRVKDDNNEIHKGNIDLIPSTISQISNTPIFLNDYRLLRKDLLDEIKTEFGVFPITDKVIFSCDYNINIYYDINGVGLLYFAAYPIISDLCSLQYFKIREASSHQTIYRDIFYFANCNPTDKIIFQLNFIDENQAMTRTLTSLFRKSDNILLAKILTVKQMRDSNNYSL